MTRWGWNIGIRGTIKQPWNQKRGQTTTASNLPSSVSGVFVGVFSTEFMCFHSFSLTFSLSDHPSPLLRQMSGRRVPERAIRIRIINIISFHCDPRCGPLHTQGREATNIMATESSQLSIYTLPPLSSPHTATHTPSAVAKLQFERRQGRSSSGSGCGQAGGVVLGPRDAIQWSVLLTNVQVKLNWKSSMAG